MKTKPTRRMFFGQAGAALAVPLAAVSAVAGERPSGENLAARLATLEDTNTIRTLLHSHAQSINAGMNAAPGAHVRTLTLDSDVAIDVVGDGTAKAMVGCNVETATPIDSNDTLVEMARLQGDGVLKRNERRVLVGSLVKHRGIWLIEQLEFRA